MEKQKEILEGMNRRIAGMEESLKSIQEAVGGRRRKFWSFIRFFFESIDKRAATYSHCVFNNPIITSIGGNYNHYHLDETGKGFFLF